MKTKQKIPPKSRNLCNTRGLRFGPPSAFICGSARTRDSLPAPGGAIEAGTGSVEVEKRASAFAIAARPSSAIPAGTRELRIRRSLDVG